MTTGCDQIGRITQPASAHALGNKVVKFFERSCREDGVRVTMAWLPECG